MAWADLHVAEDGLQLLGPWDLVCAFSPGVTVGKVKGTLEQLKSPLEQLKLC